MAFTMYKQKYVFHLFPYWRRTPTDVMSKWTDDFSGMGYSTAEYIEDYPSYRTTHTFLLKNLQEIDEVNSMLDTFLGRLTAFWFPSFRKDIILTSNIGSSATVINIEEMEYSEFYPATPGSGRYIFIYVNRNKWFARKITGVSGPTVLDIESSLGEQVNMSQIKCVSFLYLGRFDIDEFEWSFHTPEVATIELVFKELPKEYALL